MKKEVLRKIEKEKAGKTAVFLIVNLVVAIIAFSFLIGLYDAEIVKALNYPPTGSTYNLESGEILIGGKLASTYSQKAVVLNNGNIVDVVNGKITQIAKSTESSYIPYSQYKSQGGFAPGATGGTNTNQPPGNTNGAAGSGGGGGAAAVSGATTSAPADTFFTVKNNIPKLSADGKTALLNPDGSQQVIASGTPLKKVGDNYVDANGNQFKLSADQLSNLEATKQVSNFDSTFFGQTVKVPIGAGSDITTSVPVKDFFSNTGATGNMVDNMKSAGLIDTDLVGSGYHLTPAGEKALEPLGMSKDFSMTKDGKISYLSNDNTRMTLDASGKSPSLTSGSKEVGPPKTLFGDLGFFFGHIVEGLTWSAVIVGLVQMIAPMLGASKEQTNSLSLAAFGGIMAGKITTGLLQEFTNWGKTASWKGVSYGGWIGVGVGVAVALIIIHLTWEEKSYKLVTFTCKPWEAPIGGKDCEKCNFDKYRPCTEYRCRSLGQACELVNAGTTNASCVWVNPHDVSSPLIYVWNDTLTSGYRYVNDTAVRPPARGVKILRNGADECIKAFTPLSFGIQTNEPAQCKIDYNHTAKFSDMSYDFGETNLYLYNHTEKLSLPGPDAINRLSPEIKNDGTYTLYVRCQDKNGNQNEDEFSVRFCVEKGPDSTPPDMITTNFGTEAPFTFNTSRAGVILYVNEPSECKWDHEDRSYDSMDNNMTCQENLFEMNPDLTYRCSSTLTSLKSYVDNKIYFRCRDQPNMNLSSRNTNQQSFVLNLKGTQPLEMENLHPYNETVKGFGDTIAVNITLNTLSGYNEEAFCYFSPTRNENDYVLFAYTEAKVHNQVLYLASGTYTYYIKCVDLGGNAVYNSTTFKVESDANFPLTIRAFKEGEQLKLVTDEDSTCSYSNTNCNFQIKDGIDMPNPQSREHNALWDITKTYYIKCKDAYENQPSPSQCSIIVRGYNQGTQ